VRGRDYAILPVVSVRDAWPDAATNALSLVPPLFAVGAAPQTPPRPAPPADGMNRRRTRVGATSSTVVRWLWAEPNALCVPCSLVGVRVRWLDGTALC
jgi:hypothetical protein